MRLQIQRILHQIRQNVHILAHNFFVQSHILQFLNAARIDKCMLEIRILILPPLWQWHSANSITSRPTHLSWSQERHTTAAREDGFDAAPVHVQLQWCGRRDDVIREAHWTWFLLFLGV
jgi:hypothetical protein